MCIRDRLCVCLSETCIQSSAFHEPQSTFEGLQGKTAESGSWKTLLRTEVRIEALANTFRRNQCISTLRGLYAFSTPTWFSTANIHFCDYAVRKHEIRDHLWLVEKHLAVSKCTFPDVVPKPLKLSLWHAPWIETNEDWNLRNISYIELIWKCWNERIFRFPDWSRFCCWQALPNDPSYTKKSVDTAG